MASYNKKTDAKTASLARHPSTGIYAKGPIGTKKSGARATTFEGHEGYQRKDKSDLFLLAAGSLGGEDAFYESGNARTKRLVELVQKVAVKDPDWIANFLRWLRSVGNIRTAAIVGGVEAAVALAKAGIPGGRQILASVLQRADEPGEAMAYWLATRGRKVLMPKPVKRAIADAAERLYNEPSFLKWDSERAAVRFGDVIEMVRPDPSQGWKSDLFRYAIEKRHGRANGVPASLQMIHRNALLRSEGAPEDWLNTDTLREAGMTWEDALSAVGSKVDKGKIWKSVLPTLGYMALIRNLRNLDEAKVSDADVASAIARIQDPDQVAKSRQLPYRFFSAYSNAPSLRWGHALDVALTESLKNVPELGGRTLILIDTSGSMMNPLSAKSKMTYQEAAGLFGIALGLKNEADVWAWASDAYQFEFKGNSVLRNLEKYKSENGRVGWSTNLANAIQKAYVPGRYARMVVISDMQVMQYDGGLIPKTIPCYFFNLAGYASAAVETKGQVYELGGLTDHTFKLIPMLEAGETGKWPWESSDQELLDKMGRPEEVVSTELL